MSEQREEASHRAAYRCAQSRPPEMEPMNRHGCQRHYTSETPNRREFSRKPLFSHTANTTRTSPCLNAFVMVYATLGAFPVERTLVPFMRPKRDVNESRSLRLSRFHAQMIPTATAKATSSNQPLHHPKTPQPLTRAMSGLLRYPCDCRKCWQETGKKHLSFQPVETIRVSVALSSAVVW